ncbi:MAG: amidohydrolase family protein [bacterium]|nr:amidohydrolase family protein [bacterium]
MRTQEPRTHRIGMAGRIIVFTALTIASSVVTQQSSLAQSPESERGSVELRISQATGRAPVQRVFLENERTQEVIVVDLEPEIEEYSVSVSPGSYQVYGWRRDFSEMVAHTETSVDPSSLSHNLALVEVDASETVDNVVVDDWHFPIEQLMVVDGRLIDGTGADPLEHARMVVWDGNIMAVGPVNELSVLAPSRHFGMPGATILPGFVNAHVHNSYNSGILAAWTRAGVTTVRDLGAPSDLAWYSARTRFEGQPRYPRILASGPLVTCPNGYPIAGNGFPSWTVASPAEARSSVNALIDRGANVIKIVIESGVANVLSLDLATVIVETAHARDIPVSVHLVRLNDLLTALDAGVDDIAHMVVDRVSDDVIERMVADGVAWVPTLAVLGLSPANSNLRRFVEASGIVAMGNDGGYLSVPVVGMPLPEMEAMVEAGLTPLQAVIAATRDSARVCRVDHLVGTLEFGKRADALVVNGDPLIDMWTLEEVHLVLHDGVVVHHVPPRPQSPGRRFRKRATRLPGNGTPSPTRVGVRTVER